MHYAQNNHMNVPFATSPLGGPSFITSPVLSPNSPPMMAAPMGFYPVSIPQNAVLAPLPGALPGSMSQPDLTPRSAEEACAKMLMEQTTLAQLQTQAAATAGRVTPPSPTSSMSISVSSSPTHKAPRSLSVHSATSGADQASVVSAVGSSAASPKNNNKPRSKSDPVASPRKANVEMDQTRRAGVITRIGTEPLVDVAGFGVFRFAYRHLKKFPHEPRPQLTVGNLVECKFAIKPEGPVVVSIRLKATSDEPPKLLEDEEVPDNA
eukprot:TRINITY_DN13495_c0_g1_i1.p1 TRINITY_DN13495_c0_g1~~TRINITY_DN13495_c0_g1_i1.p1  ORF type:complete len:265 (+),score=69.85 TRINITY_DN13495_c0_g1_i1:48-842(+)